MKYKEKPHKARGIFKRKRKSSHPRYMLQGRVKHALFTPVKEVSQQDLVTNMLEKLGFNVKH